MTAFLKFLHQKVAVDVKQKLPHYCMGEVAPGNFDEMNITELNSLAQKRKIIFISAFVLNFAGKPEKICSLSQEIKSNIC